MAYSGEHGQPHSDDQTNQIDQTNQTDHFPLFDGSRLTNDG